MAPKFVIGLMSGSSLDGIDLVYSKIENNNRKYSAQVIASQCVPYSSEWISKLKTVAKESGNELWKIHTALGAHFGKVVKQFVLDFGIEKVDFVASHGHTVFHSPELGFTTQIGEGASLSANCGFPVVCDFRTADVANKGTGAPIVPIADLLLFSEYDFCLNLGGIANISAKKNQEIVAFDIAPCNQLLDFFSSEKGKPFDDEGFIARSGSVVDSLLQKLLDMEYHRLAFPKSLDNGFKNQLLPLFDGLKTEEKLRTAVEYIAISISWEMQLVARKMGINLHSASMFVTGGGAFNRFLLERIQALTPSKMVVPNSETIKFKEAIAMALIGFLRWHEQPNVLSSVTGATKNTINGAIYMP